MAKWFHSKTENVQNAAQAVKYAEDAITLARQLEAEVQLNQEAVAKSIHLNDSQLVSTAAEMKDSLAGLKSQIDANRTTLEEGITALQSEVINLRSIDKKLISYMAHSRLESENEFNSSLDEINSKLELLEMKVNKNLELLSSKINKTESNLNSKINERIEVLQADVDSLDENLNILINTNNQNLASKLNKIVVSLVVVSAVVLVSILTKVL